MTEKKQNNNHSWHERLSHAGVLRILRRNVILQASLAILTIVLTILLVFSLTAAWYTNVVQTGGLGFKAEEWKFDGEIELLSHTNITASPGDQGVIPLRITNDGDHIVAASATVNQSGLDEDMKKRLYFYVDTSMTRNGETMDRVYISEKSSYTYTIFPHSALELSETVQNGPLIKWMWVYDVLGYYVWGQRTEDAVVPSDYIRPVEYSYDPTTTTFDENGKLTTVDGSMSVATFLEELTATDGYEGRIASGTQSIGGYYPVDVNESGYGVWLYLCDYDEIQRNMTYDTSVGSDATQTYVATVTVTGANSREDSLPVSSVEELQAALASPTVGIIQLSDDLELTETLTMSGGSATIDLNGKTLSVGDGVQKIVTLSQGAKLSLENGTLEGSGLTDDHTAVTVKESHLTMNDVTVSNVGTGVRVEEAAEGSTVYISGCTITADQQAIWFYDRTAEAASRTRVEIHDSTITGNQYAGILCSGNYSSTDLLVSGCTVTGYYTSIYHPQRDSTMTIENNCVLTGNTGLVIKGGSVMVSDSSVHGTLENGDIPKAEGSGWSDTGDGIYLDASYAENNADWATSVTVINSTVTSDYAYAVRMFESTAQNAALTVQSGTYTSFAMKKNIPNDFAVATYMAPYAGTNQVTVSDDDSMTCIVSEATATP